MQSDPLSLVGKSLGPFKVLEYVGEGGMAYVYRGVQPDVGNREVALKIAKRQLGPQILQRFVSEAAAAGRLHHDNIVPVYAAGTENGHHYIAMRFVRGHTLEDVLTRSNPARDHAYILSILEQVARALDYSHSCGVVHCDVNPRNIMLEGEAQRHAYVTDFGIARALHDGAGRTVPGMPVVGTLPYMAPEQWDPQRFGPVGPKADLWALAVVAYRMLTGRMPFESPDGSMTALQWKVCRENPPPPSTRNRDLRPVDDAICGHGLAKMPASRPVSCAALVHQLRRALRQRPRVAPWRAMVVGVVLISLAGAAVWWVMNPRPVPPPSKKATVPLLVGQTQDGAESTLAPDFKCDKVGTEISLTDPDKVAWQEPEAGAEVDKDSTVRIWLSRGPQVPAEIEGMELAEAKRLMNSHSLPVVQARDERHSRTIRSGCVITSRPAPGHRLGLGDTFTFVVSIGAAPPPDTVRVQVCPVSGQRATRWCPTPRAWRTYRRGREPSYCTTCPPPRQPPPPPSAPPAPPAP